MSTETKIHSVKSNAARAAVKAGLTRTDIEAVEGGWIVKLTGLPEEPTTAQQKVETAYQRGEQWAVEAKMAERLTTVQQDISDALAEIAEEYVTARIAADTDDKRAEAFQAALFAAFEIGQSEGLKAAKPARKAREPRPAGGESKVAQAGRLLQQSCTAREILDLTGWPTVSVPAVAKANGLDLRKEKIGKVTFYFGTPKKEG